MVYKTCPWAWNLRTLCTNSKESHFNSKGLHVICSPLLLLSCGPTLLYLTNFCRTRNGGFSFHGNYRVRHMQSTVPTSQVHLKVIYLPKTMEYSPNVSHCLFIWPVPFSCWYFPRPRHCHSSLLRSLSWLPLG